MSQMSQQQQQHMRQNNPIPYPGPAQLDQQSQLGLALQNERLLDTESRRMATDNLLQQNESWSQEDLQNEFPEIDLSAPCKLTGFKCYLIDWLGCSADLVVVL